MTDALSFSAMSAAALTSAFKFLFDRAGKLLDRRADRRGNAADTSTTVDDDPAASEVAVRQLEALRQAVAVLEVYHDHSIVIRPDDVRLVCAMDTARTQMEAILGQPLDFTAVLEACADVVIKQEVEQVAGTTVGMKAASVGGETTVEINQAAHTVAKGAEMIGLQVDGPLR
jgi:hypothetical protein